MVRTCRLLQGSDSSPEIGLLQTINFGTNSKSTQADIKSLEAARDALVASLLKALHFDDRSDSNGTVGP